MNRSFRSVNNYTKYLVSEDGLVLSSNKPRRILKPNQKPNGYFYVGLSSNGVVKYFHVHRLVAESFIPNPENKPEVNHIDGDKSNNHFSNLEWVSHHENILHSHSVSVRQFDLSGNFIQEWSSISEASRIGGFKSGAIVKCCKGQYSHHHGFIFKYSNHGKKDNAQK